MQIKKDNDHSSSKINQTLVSGLCPTAIQFEKLGFDYGSFYCIGQTVVRYPSTGQYDWLTEVCNYQNTITSLTYTPESNPDIILKDINRTVASHKLMAEGHVRVDEVQKARSAKIVNDSTKLINQIANNNESMGEISITTLSVGNDKKEAADIAKSIKNRFTGRMFDLRNIPYMQEGMLKACSPCTKPPHQISDVGNHVMPISTMLGGFPFAFSGYNDGYGSYWGKDSSGGLIVIDTWKRGRDRTNSNMIMMGISGAGKSTALKHLIQNEWEIGTKFIIIDPHGEYKDLCKNLHGDWINATGGASGQMINPLHIYAKAEETDENGSIIIQDELARHINNLEVFFKLYLNPSQQLIAALKECLILAYEKKGITWGTDVARLKADQFPIMQDLYAICLKKSDERDGELKKRARGENYYEELALLLRDISLGADSRIWNGISTVNPQNDLVIFDVSQINGNTPNVKTALYHTVLNYCEDYLYKNPNERVILVCDEAHNVVDKRMPATLARLANIEKSCRKFESGIWICSQQIIDFLDEAIKKEGSALLDQPCIKLLMPVGKGTDLKELKALYSLTDAEEEILMEQERGKGLLMIGTTRISIKFEIPEHHLLLMGTGGGR